MERTDRPSPIPAASLNIIAVIMIVAALKTAQSIILPVILATFLAVIGTPLVHWLERKRVPSGIAVALTVSAMVILLALVTAPLAASFNDFSAQVPVYQQRIEEGLEELSETFDWRGNALGGKVSIQDLLKRVDPGLAMGLTARLLGGLGSVFANTFLIVATLIFILLEASEFPLKLRAILSDSRRALVSFERFAANLNRYLVIKTIVSSMTGLAVIILLVILRVDFPIMWGVLAFFLNFIPAVGSIIAAVPAVLLAFIQFGPGRAAVVALGYLVINTVIGNFLEPRIMGKGLGMSALVVFLSLVFWGWVFGPVGMLISVPLTMTIMIALESREETRWLSVLLCSASSLPAAQSGDETVG